MSFTVIDIETNAIDNPDKLWCIVTKDLDSGSVSTWSFPSGVPGDYPEAVKGFLSSSSSVSAWVGHNIIGYDLPHLTRLIPTFSFDPKAVIDTLVVSRLLNYSVEGGSSLEAWGERLGFPKTSFSEFSSYSQQMLDYCINDVLVTEKLYALFTPYLSVPTWKQSLRLEHDISFLCGELHNNGFYFDITGGKNLYLAIQEQLRVLESTLAVAFPRRVVFVGEVHPKLTKHGTLSRSQFRFLEDPLQLTQYNGGPFSRIRFEPFNPGSTKQCVERLWQCGWRPFDKTKGHIAVERELEQLRRAPRTSPGGRGVAGGRQPDGGPSGRIAELESKLEHFRKYGWKLSEANLNTLPRVEPLKEWVDNCRIKLLKPEELTNDSTIANIARKSELKLGDTIPITNIITGTNDLNVLTASVQKIITSFVPNNTDVVKFVETTSHLWLITVTEQGIFVDCSAGFVTDTWDGLSDTANLQQNISQIEAAHKLVQWLTLDSRRSTLEEWFSAYNENTGRIHGRFNHIGTWTGRMSHNSPNMANIPGHGSLYGDEMRSLWAATPGSYLVGVDADGIQLRVLAHYMNDPDFIEALTKGRKEDGTDAHTLNKLALGNACRDRDTAKTFIYAFLLGAGVPKIAEILGCTGHEARGAVDAFLSYYPGLRDLKDHRLPSDAARGYFSGLDGRLVACTSEHLMLAGYLQNGEAVIMKTANLIWRSNLRKEGIDFKQVNFVHDEWQVEVNSLTDATKAGTIMVSAIEEAGKQLKLNCPLTGNSKIGRNWLETH